MKVKAVQTKLSYSVGEYVLLFFLSIIAANARVLGMFSPFAVGLTAVMPYKMSYISFIGSLLGYILLGGPSQNMVYIVSLLGVMAVKNVIRNNKTFERSYSFLSIVVFLLLLSLQLVFHILASATVVTIIIGICGSLLGGAMTFFSGISVDTVSRARKIKDYTLIERTSLCIVGIVLLISLANFEFAGFNIARIAGVFAILFCTYKFGITGGSLSAIVVTIAMTLYSTDYALMSGTLIIAAFLSALFVHFGRIGQVAAFIAVNTFIILILGGSTSYLEQMLDILAAVAIFMLIPERILEKIIISSPIAVRSPDTIELKSGLSSKLDFTSKTLLNLQDNIEGISQKMQEIYSNDIFTVYTKTAESICKNCGFNTFCWVTAYSEIMQALNSNVDILRENGKLTMQNIAPFFKHKCCKLEEFIAVSNHNYKDYLASENAARRVTEARMVAIEQFEGMANMLKEISAELSEIEKYDDKCSQKVLEIFENNGYTVEQACCIIDKYGRLGIELYINQNTKGDLKTICRQLSDTLDRELEMPSVVTVDGRTKISFFEKANYAIDFCGSQIVEDNNRICGDTYEYFLDSKGFAYMVLSDGMGSGGRAAIDSVMTCSLMMKLLKAGFGFHAAIKLINSSFLVKSQDESLATIDAVRIDLYTGAAEFYKAGAVTSFVYKDSGMVTVDSGSLPIGILQGVEFDQYEVRLHKGDILVVVSDGVTASGTDWIESEIELFKDKSAKTVSNRIANEAKRRRLDGHSDDITVLVAKISKGI